MPTATLPAKVTATLADEGPDGWSVFRLRDTRGYTHREDTIRISHRGIERLSRDGWHHLLDVHHPMMGKPVPEPDWTDGVQRAVAVLYGMEDHG